MGQDLDTTQNKSKDKEGKRDKADKVSHKGRSNNRGKEGHKKEHSDGG